MRPFREITSDFRRRAFDIDCIDMLLVQKTSEKPILFRGKGYIRQTADDKFTCKIFAEETENVTQWDWMKREISGEPGKLYSTGDYFDLIAKDTRQIVWRAEKVLPNIGWHGKKPQLSLRTWISSPSKGVPTSPSIPCASISSKTPIFL